MEMFFSVGGGCFLEANPVRPVSVQGCVEDPHVVQTLPILIVHAHSSCNCRCVMCDIWKTRDTQRFGVRDLELQLDSIRRLGVRWVVFSGGEPLMNPELPELCAILQEQGIRLTLLSTGLLLKNYAPSVAANFDDVIVSLDGPPQVHDAIRRVEGAFGLLQAGICALRGMRKDMSITARCTIQKANHNRLLETARSAKLLQLKSISFLAADLTSSAFNRSVIWPTSRQMEIGLSLSESLALEDQLEALIRDSGKELGAGFIAESPAKLRRIARHFRVQLGLESAESPVCNAPWTSAVIEADGMIRPCFFHRSIGNLRETTLEAVINGTEGLKFRKSLNIASDSICRNCVCSLNYRP
jgi:Fe-coproporphyrin III synthase